jgi:hypothetical protein
MMTRYTLQMLVAIVIGMATGLAGYFYGMHRSDRLMNDLEYLNQANRISLGLQIIQLANSGNVDAIRYSQERIIGLSIGNLKGYGVDSDGANKLIILESLVKLRDYQMKNAGKVAPDLNTLLERLQ